jgi:hypothetical protein
MNERMYREYPKCVQDKINHIQEKGGTAICHDQEFTYVVLALGERRTGGYRIEVIDAEQQSTHQGEIIVVKAKEIKPEPGQMVIQVITYPIAVYRLPRSELPIEVIWV